MTINNKRKNKLIVELEALRDHDDPEYAHGEADDLLIAFINDKEVSEAYSNIPKWYS